MATRGHGGHNVVLATLAALMLSGCAGLRIDPSGRSLFVTDSGTGVTTVPAPATGAAAPSGAPIVSAPPPVVTTPAPPVVTTPAPPLVLQSDPTLTLQVSPADVIAPVGSEVVMVASVFGPQSLLQPKQRIEWTLTPSGVGHFASAGQQSGFDWLFCSTNAEKLAADYVVSYTSTQNYILNRGTTATMDDLSILAGQTWVTVSSPIEGISYVNALAPQLGAWGARQRTSRVYWVDAQWSFPPVATASAGASVPLSTSLLRLSDGAALAGYRVRYTVTGGVPAGFGPAEAQTIEVDTDGQGLATIELVQGAPTAGASDVRVDILRPQELGGYDGRTLTVASGTTQVTWTTSAPPATAPSPAPMDNAPSPPPTAPAPEAPPEQLDVRILGPTTAMVGEVATFRITVTNRGTATTPGLLVQDQFDTGFAHERQTNPIERDLAPLAPGQASEFDLSFTVVGSGRLRHTITVLTAEGAALATATSELLATSNVSAPPSEAPPAAPPDVPPPSAEAPPTLETDGTAAPPAFPLAALGVEMKLERQTDDSAAFSFRVENSGDVDLHDVLIENSYDAPFEPKQASRGFTREGDGLAWRIDVLPAGSSLTYGVVYERKTPSDSACSRIAVTCREGQRADDQACLTIRENPAAP